MHRAVREPPLAAHPFVRPVAPTPAMHSRRRARTPAISKRITVIRKRTWADVTALTDYGPVTVKIALRLEDPSTPEAKIPTSPAWQLGGRCNSTSTSRRPFASVSVGGGVRQRHEVVRERIGAAHEHDDARAGCEALAADGDPLLATPSCWIENERDRGDAIDGTWPSAGVIVDASLGSDLEDGFESSCSTRRARIRKCCPGSTPSHLCYSVSK